MRRLAVPIALLLALAGCQAATAEQPRSADTTSPSAVSTAPPVRERTAKVPVPAGFVPVSVDFADALHGYALFSRCEADGCQGALFATVDGGQSWTGRAMPALAGAKTVQLEVLGAGAVAVWTDPPATYVSRDGGRSFATFPAPTDARPLRAVVFGASVPWLRCTDGAGCVVEVLGADGLSRPAPAQPPGPGRVAGLDVDTRRRPWVTLVDGDHLATAISPDQGLTWVRQEVPGPARGAPAMTSIAVSVQLTHAWLLSYTEPTPTDTRSEPAVGAVTGARFPGVVPRKPFGVPSMWTMDAAGWRPVQVERGPKVFGGAAVDNSGGLWAAGDGAVGRVSADGWWTVVMRPASRVGWLTGLPDGTLVASAERSAGERWLRDGTGWVHVAVEAQHGS